MKRRHREGARAKQKLRNWYARLAMPIENHISPFQEARSDLLVEAARRERREGGTAQ
jgi:hypothetical protein